MWAHCRGKLVSSKELSRRTSRQSLSRHSRMREIQDYMGQFKNKNDEIIKDAYEDIFGKIMF